MGIKGGWDVAQRLSDIELMLLIDIIGLINQSQSWLTLNPKN